MVCFLFFFFRQKTAYEMRISDWSSDVCSSDLGGRYLDVEVKPQAAARYGFTQADVQRLIATVIGGQPVDQTIQGRERYPVVVRYPRPLRDSAAALARSEERRGGTECGSKCRFRWAPYHLKKKQHDRNTYYL